VVIRIGASYQLPTFATRGSAADLRAPRHGHQKQSQPGEKYRLTKHWTDWVLLGYRFARLIKVPVGSGASGITLLAAFESEQGELAWTPSRNAGPAAIS
jgi:hypothetical protein